MAAPPQPFVALPEEEVKKELKKANIADFFQSQTLSDITLTNPLTGAQYKSHKVILASGSKYFLELFLTEDASKIVHFDTPKPIPVTGDKVDDAISKILKYFYHNQDFSVIKAEVNESNATFLLSQAFVLKSDHLKQCLEDLIIKSILKPNNCSQFFLDSLKFQSEKIQKACEKIMVMNFAEISSDEKGLQFLRDLPAEAFKSICEADNLYIEDEKIVVDLISGYLKHREGLPILDEEDPMKNWSNLTEEEKKKREEEEAKKHEEEKKKHEEEEKKHADEYAKLDDLGKIQANWNKKVDEIHKQSLDRLKVKRLNKTQKTELFKSIRYSFLHHEQLLSMTMNPMFELAKNFIVEGLTYKIDSKEKNQLGKELQININPRVYYEAHDSHPTQYHEEAKNPLGGMFNQALAQRASQPVQINKKKFYSNYDERKQDEEFETKKDVVKSLIDVIEFFSALAIFSSSRVEDKIRFFFEFFDMNENNYTSNFIELLILIVYLEEVDLQFLFTSCIAAICKTFSITDEETQEEAFAFMCKLIRQSFPDGMKVTIADMLKWGTTAIEFKEFFTLVELFNQKHQVQVYA